MADKEPHWYVAHTYSGYEKKVKANIEMAFLPDELFKQRNKSMTITFGRPIDVALLDNSRTDAQWAEQLRCFSYTLENDENALFDPKKDYVM